MSIFQKQKQLKQLIEFEEIGVINDQQPLLQTINSKFSSEKEICEPDDCRDLAQ